MPPDKVEYRPIVKLHPRLEGKSVLFIEGYGITSSPVWHNRCHLERLIVESMDNLPMDSEGKAIRLVEYMRLISIDSLIIHPVANATWIQDIIEVLETKKPVVIIYGATVDAETADTFQWFYDVHIPMVEKYPEKFYERLLDSLDQAFAAKEQ